MKNILYFICLAAVPGCSVGGSGSGASNAPLVQGQVACYGSQSGGSFTTVNSTYGNQLTITIGGSGVCGLTANAPCTSVTICQHGSTTNCQTISDVLLDTGSYGLRLFASSMSSSLCSSLTQVTDVSSHPIGECQAFGTGATWGPVMKADLQLAGEPVVQLPIQIINASFGYMPSACSQLQYDFSPQDSHFNGILGVGLFGADCGSNCAIDPNNNQYFSCTGTSCSGATVSTANQVQNPIPLLAADNQGVLVDMGTPSGGSAASFAGVVNLGIGTQSVASTGVGVNTPSNTVVVYQANPSGMSGTFTTNFNSANYTGSFLDSGSNCLFFKPPSTSYDCTNPQVEGFLCPPGGTASLSATMTGYGVSQPSIGISFRIDDAFNLFSTNHAALQYLGASTTGLPFTNLFDWGFPFFYGRKIWIGTSGKSATFNSVSKTGPYWAF